MPSKFLIKHNFIQPLKGSKMKIKQILAVAAALAVAGVASAQTKPASCGKGSCSKAEAKKDAACGKGACSKEELVMKGKKEAACSKHGDKKDAACSKAGDMKEAACSKAVEKKDAACGKGSCAKK
jgi:hypothetical protein